MLLSTRLVRWIERNAEELTRGVVEDLQSNPGTPSFHALPRRELHQRAHEIYHNLGVWLSCKDDEAIERFHDDLARARLADGVPLSEIVFSLLLKKYHLRDYIRASGLADSALDLYQEKELQVLIGQFFDKGLYYAVKACESELGFQTRDEELVARQPTPAGTA